MVIPSLITEFYQERIRDNLASMKYLARDIGEMNRIREALAGDWEIGELARAIIFEEAQTIENLREEISLDEQRIRERERRSVEGVG